MLNVSKFVKDHIPLCVCTLGLAVVGYLGYHAVKWIINKCHKTEKIDQVAHKALAPIKDLNRPAPIKNPELKLKQAPPYKVEKVFPGGIAYQSISPEAFTKKIITVLDCKKNSHHIPAASFVLRNSDFEEFSGILGSYLKTLNAASIDFKILKSKYKVEIFFQPNPVKKEILAEGIIRQTYANGIIEEVGLDYLSCEKVTFDLYSHLDEMFYPVEERCYHYQGLRIFPDGKKEKGMFCPYTRNFQSGYRLALDGSIEFIRPKPFVSYSSEGIEFGIYDIEGSLVVIKKTKDSLYAITDIPVENVLLKSIEKRKEKDKRYISKVHVNEDRGGFGGTAIKGVLLHKSFSKSQKTCIEFFLAPDELGTPRLFRFGDQTVLDIIEIGSKIIDFDPLKIVDPVSGRNLILQAAYWGSEEVLNKLIELFPDKFLTFGQSVIEELLTQKWSADLVYNISQEFQKLGGVLDTYHSLTVEVARGTKPGITFKDRFSLLSIDQKQKLYNYAFIYENPFVMEPADIPVTADQYSINLMWINKNKVNPRQRFLFGDGASVQEQESDFHDRFIRPVSKWAKKHAGSRINIWVDGAMASKDVIERSKTLLKENLKGTDHGDIEFRDVRSIDIVSANPDVFSEEMPIYFRVDLLRAIAADYVLRKKETKFFVYGDIDMKPISGKKIFDKRTVNFLNDVGFVMAKEVGTKEGFENGFQILNGDNAQFIDSHRKVLIDLSIEMALECPDAINQQQIFRAYPAILTYFLAADGRYGKFCNTRGKEYEEELTDLLPKFRFDCFQAYPFIPVGSRSILLKDVMPKKPVVLPLSHFSSSKEDAKKQRDEVKKLADIFYKSDFVAFINSSCVK